MDASKYFYNCPKQVMFLDPDTPGDDANWLTGIAYKDEIICSCCGGVFAIKDVLEMAEGTNVTDPIHGFDSWADLTGDIQSGELALGLMWSQGKIVEMNENISEEHQNSDFQVDGFTFED